MRASGSAGIYPLHLELTKCQLAGSFPARCEHAARGWPPVIDLTDRVDFHGARVCYIQAPLSPCCTGVDIYETCRRGPLDRTNERARPGGGLRSLTLPSRGHPWYCRLRWGTLLICTYTLVPPKIFKILCGCVSASRACLLSPT